MSYLVVATRRDMALRIALGADPRRIIRSVVGRGGRLAGYGIALGALGALVVLRAVRSLLFGVAALDPVAYLAAAAFILLAATTAAAIPARRAGTLDAATTLREE